jgi:hypothetical protein
MAGFAPAPTDRSTTNTGDQGGPSEQDTAGANHMADDTLYLVLFHVEDAHGAPLAGASATAISDNGDWASSTNPCGDVIDPGTGIAGVMLSPGDYKITFSKAGYTDRPLDVTIVAEGPPIRVGLERAHGGGGGSGTLPPIPTRAQVCAVQHSLAGLTYHTKEFGDVPAWFYGALNAEDRAEAREQHRKAGDTHIPFPLTEAYREPGTLWPPELREGYDYTSDLDTYRVIAHEIIADGFFIDAPMGGDGLGEGPGWNDPVGKTYGCQWLLANMERILLAMQGDGTHARPDLNKYICWRPGWDAIFYSWGDPAAAAQGLRWRWTRIRDAHPTPLTAKQLDEQQARVKLFGERFRQILPEGYLSIEHTPGNIPCGEGGQDYSPGGLMTTYDTIMGEYNHFHEDAYWQVAGRMISPYHRPPDQPADDDTHPPFYLGPGSPRGPYFYVVFEPAEKGVYEWCRGRCTREEMQQEDAYIRATGATLTGYPVHW